MSTLNNFRVVGEVGRRDLREESPEATAQLELEITYMRNDDRGRGQKSLHIKWVSHLSRLHR